MEENPPEKEAERRTDARGSPGGPKPKRIARVSIRSLEVDSSIKAVFAAIEEPLRTTLRESIYTLGFTEPLYVWAGHGVVLDGIARLEIAKELGIEEADVVEVDLPDKAAAKAFRLEVNFGRRHLNVYQRCLCALRQEEFYKALGKINQVRGGKGEGCKKEDKIDTLAALARLAQTSRDTVARVKYIERYLEQAVGKARANEAYSRLAAGEKSIHVVCNDIKRAWKPTHVPPASIPVSSLNDAENDGKDGDASSPTFENQIICAGAIDGLKRLPDGVVTCIITSPPYLGVGTDYSGAWDDNISYEKYLLWLKQVLKECSRVLSIGGRLAVNIDAIRNRKDDESYIYPIYADLVALLRDPEVNLKFFADIAWVKQNLTGKKMALGSRACPNIRRNHEYIIIAAKAQFKLPQIGNQPSDLTDKELNCFTMSTWAIPPVHRRKKEQHPHPYPEELVERLVKLYSHPGGDLICDPFLGSGTTTAVAARLGRKYFGIDKNASYVAAARKRTENAAKAATNASVKPLRAAGGREPGAEEQESDTHEPETRTAA
jgi:site-specific DNA-methyltransferase (adenine-specific)